MKVMKCDSCSANLNPEDGQVNVKCEYCGTVIRVVGEGAEQYSSENILNQILELGTGRVRKDSFDSMFQRAKDFIEQHKYAEANKILNEVLEEDHTQARAYFYKSLLPVLEQESIMYKGCYINIIVLAQITNRHEISAFLTECGLPWYRHSKFMRFYGSVDFLYEQQLKFLDKAIEHASTKERRNFFSEQKKLVIKKHRSKLRRTRIGNFLLILLLAAVVIGGIILIGEVVIDNLKSLFG